MREVFADFREGRWHADVPGRTVTGGTLRELTERLYDVLPDAGRIVVNPRVPAELEELKRKADDLAAEYGELKAKADELAARARRAQWEYELGYQRLGMVARDTGVILNIAERTVLNHRTRARAELGYSE